MNKNIITKKNLLILGFCIVFSLNFLSSAVQDFEIKTTLLKENIPLGGKTSSTILIKNNADYEQTFNIRFENFAERISIDEETFVIGAEDSKSFEVFIEDTQGIGVYLGVLVIETDKFTNKIPIVLTVEEKDPSFVILQEAMATHKNVYSGGKLWLEIKFFDLLKSGTQETKINYSIKDFNNNILFSEYETKIIDESDIMTKVVDIPSDFKSGEYVFIITLENRGHTYVSAYMFEIEKGQATLGNLEYYFIILVIFVLGMFGLMYYLVKSRDKFLVELHEQQNKEVKGNLSVLNRYKKDVNKIKDIYEKRKKLNELEKKKKEVLAKIKRKQKLQKNELAKLIKEKKLGEVKRKLASWEKEGYSFSEVRKNFKDLSGENVKKKLSQWKKQGYKF